MPQTNKKREKKDQNYGYDRVYDNKNFNLIITPNERTVILVPFDFHHQIKTTQYERKKNIFKSKNGKYFIGFYVTRSSTFYYNVRKYSFGLKHEHQKTINLFSQDFLSK